LQCAAKYSNQGSHVMLSTSIDRKAVAVHVEYTGISLKDNEFREIFLPEGAWNQNTVGRVSITEESLWKCKKLAEFNSATIRYDAKRIGDEHNGAIGIFTVTFQEDTKA